MFTQINYTITSSDVTSEAFNSQLTLEKQHLAKIKTNLKNTKDSLNLNLEKLTKVFNQKSNEQKGHQPVSAERAELERKRIEIELKEQELDVRERFNSLIEKYQLEIEQSQERIAQLEAEGSARKEDEFFKVEINNNKISITKWVDVKVKKDQTLFSLSEYNGFYQIQEGVIGITFKSSNPELDVKRDIDGVHQVHIVYPQVKSPVGLELVIYILDNETL